MTIRDPSDVEGREFGLAPFFDGMNLEAPKFFARPGSLASCINYEVVTMGYERSQGLMRYDGTFDLAVTNMWYFGDITANATFSGSFTLGGKLTWFNGEGYCVYIRDDVDVKAIGITRVRGKAPNDTIKVITDVETGNTFTLTGSRSGLQLGANNNSIATDPLTGNLICETVQDYLDFVNSVNLELVNQTSSAWDAFKPEVPGAGPILGGFQFQDSVYAARTWPHIFYKSGENRPDIGDILTIGTASVEVLRTNEYLNVWEEGTSTGFIVCRPYDGGTYDMATLEAQVTTDTTITNTTKAETVGLVQRNFSTEHGGAGLLWKATVNGWKHVDLGYSVRFEAGTTPPIAQVTPLYLAEQTNAVRDTGWMLPDAGVNKGAAPFINWTNPGNITSAASSEATVTLAVGEESSVLEAQWSVGDYIDAQDSEVIGIELRVDAKSTAGGEIDLSEVYLVDAGGAGADDRWATLNHAGFQTLTSVGQNFDLGGQIDLWGWRGKDVLEFNNGDIKARIKVRNNGAAGDTAEIEAVYLKVHYVAQGQKVYFRDWSNSNDVATGYIYSFDLHDGSWAGNDAEGWLTVHDVDNPEAIPAATGIYTEPGAGGDFIGRTSSNMEPNYLPDQLKQDGDEVRDRPPSMWQTVQTNFFEHEDGESIYGCTGAGHAFLFNSAEKFAFIRLPISPKQDYPRHIAVHRNHLMLSVGTHVLVSSIGAPTVFATSEDATSWSLGDTVTGLCPIDGNTSLIMCRESLHAFTGSFFDEFQIQNINSRTGGREYTLVPMKSPLFVDFNGISNIQSTDEFGDFKTRPFSAAIEQWLMNRLQDGEADSIFNKQPVAAIGVRGKNQYRLFFDDGYILNVGLPLGEGDGPKHMLMHYDTSNFSNKAFVPTWVNSTILTGGRERVVMGTSDGKVWVVDGANTMLDEGEQTDLFCFLILNPMNQQYLQGPAKYHRCMLFGDFHEAQSFDYAIGIDYRFPSGSSVSKTVGNYANSPDWLRQPNYVEFPVNTLTDGFSLRIRTQMDGSMPHRFTGILAQTKPTGAMRNSTQRNRG